jgi:hypothetical protein
MAGKTYDNSGIISKNDRKTEPGHADHTGSCTIEGKEFWINGWIKEKDGRRFLSLSFRPKEPRTQSSKPSQGPRQAYIPDDEPF